MTPAGELAITRAEPGHEAEILALARRALGWTTDPRFDDLYRWKHDENPNGPSPRWVALADGEVVGFRVLLPWRFRRGAETVTAVRAVDTATDPDHQGRGIFKALTTTAVAELTAEGTGFVFNSPNDQSRPGYLKMGWITLGRPPVAVTPRPRSLPRIARSRTPADHWSTPCPAGTPAPVFLADRAALDAAHDPQLDDGRWRTDRTAPWLEWRYGLSHLDYRVLTTGDLPRGERLAPGAAIFRTRRRGDALEATVADVLTSTPATRRALVRATLRATGADYVLAEASAPVDRTPSVALRAFSPLVTWRALAVAEAPALSDFAFALGDLELF